MFFDGDLFKPICDDRSVMSSYVNLWRPAALGTHVSSKFQINFPHEISTKITICVQSSCWKNDQTFTCWCTLNNLCKLYLGDFLIRLSISITSNETIWWDPKYIIGAAPSWVETSNSVRLKYYCFLLFSNLPPKQASN